MQSYKCNKCGAELIINNDISFTKCLYCGNSIAIVKDNEKNLNIKEIIPFSIEKEDVIKYYKKYYGGDVLEAKKVYVPVRYCNYEFDYLIDYNYIIEREDVNIHYDKEDLIDGYMENDIIFGNTKVKKVLFEGLFDEIKDKRLKFDYAILKDVSIECSGLNDEEPKEKLMKKVRAFSIMNIYNRYNVWKVYHENYFVSDVEIEDFSTLIPVYLVKNKNGIIYNMPGIQKIYNIANRKRIINTIQKTVKISILAAIIIAILSYFIYLIILDENHIINNSLDSLNIKTNTLIVAIFVWLITTFIIYYLMKKKSVDRVDKKVENDYKYTRYIVSREKVD